MNDLVIPNPLDISTHAAPEAIALEWDGRAWTFAALRDASIGAASLLRDAGQAGRIGILSRNRAGLAIVVHAAARLGRAVVPLNWRLSPAELQWQIHDAGISLLVSDSWNAAIAAALASACGVPSLAIEDCEDLPVSDAVIAESTLTLEQDAAIIYTSGTSGRPKGARITFGNLWFGAIASGLHLGHTPDDSWLATLPLYHIGGFSILYRSVIQRTSVVLHDRFDPHPVLNAIAAGATLISVVPTMLQRLLAIPGAEDCLRLPRCFLVGGAATPISLINTCLDLGIPIAPTYGLTESTAQLATLLPREVALKPGSVGRPLPLSRVRIVTGDRDARPGEAGEIAFAGPTRFPGYLNNSADSFMSSSDWFATGDLGYLDADGHLYIVGRRDDLIVSGGENISPGEVEQVLLGHPAVRDAGVVGVPDPVWGARPIAFVVWDDSASIAERERQVIEHCQERLARFKLPVRIIARPELPRTSSGKLLRRELREFARNLVAPDE